MTSMWTALLLWIVQLLTGAAVGLLLHTIIDGLTPWWLAQQTWGEDA